MNFVIMFGILICACFTNSSQLFEEQNLVKRGARAWEQFVPCTNVIGCLANFNKAVPVRLNFNPITAYDRFRSHFEGNNGWTNIEVQNFEELRNKIKRILAKQRIRNRIYREEKKLWKARIQRKIQEFQTFLT